MKNLGLIDSINQGRQLTTDQYFMYSELLDDLEKNELVLMNNAIALALGGGKKEGGPDGGTPAV